MLGVILAAGQGRRLGALSVSRPKPLLPVLNVPLMAWSLDQLHNCGVRHAWINVSYLADRVRDVRPGLEQASGVLLHIVREDRLTGPAGGLLACLRQCPPSEHTVAVHGDVFVTESYAGLIEAHLVSDSDVTMLVTQVQEPWRFGAITARDGMLTGWMEKSPNTSPGSFINAGVYVFSPRAREACLRYATPGSCDFKDLLPWLAALGMSVRVHATTGLWYDIGTQESLMQLNLDLLGQTAWRTRAATLACESSRYDAAHHNWIATSAEIGAASLNRSIVGPQASITSHCKLTECVVLAGAAVPPGTVARHTVLG